MQRGVYRIIDANFNRAREALRVIEEFCRFVLNSQPLTERVKQLRHELSSVIGRVDSGLLICSRDTAGDVGVDIPVDGQFGRSDLDSCFTAGCKRLTEALRALAEMVQTFNPSDAAKIEKLRYAAYTLEKDILLSGDTAEKFRQVRLYVIITRDFPADVINLAHRCVLGGADCIQLRAKDIDDDKLFALAVEFVKICKAAKVLSIINDRVDIAVAAGADGVHLGQDDLPVGQARRLELTPLIIGRSSHSLEQLHSACGEGVTYVSLGPVYPTPTKPNVKPVELDYIGQAKEVLAETGIASVAIGGITLDNVDEVLKAGAGAVAVCSAVTEAVDPAAVCRAFKQKIADFIQ